MAPTESEITVTPRTHTFEINGMTVRTRTPRRFIVVKTRPRPHTGAHGTYAAFATVECRTDSGATAAARVRRIGMSHSVEYGCIYAVVYDTETGKVV